MTHPSPAPAALPRRGLPSAAFALLRPKQWTKNGLLFAALVFSESFDDLAIVRALLAFAAFCLLSSTGYVFNDYLDVDADRNHPKKRLRPLASGEIGPAGAWGLMAACFVGSMVLAFAVDAGFTTTTNLAPGDALDVPNGYAFLWTALLYFATTLSYSHFFKHIVILDVMMLSACYLWRAVAGAVAIRVPISPWLLLCTAFLALFLGFNKRRGEIALLEGTGGGTRKSLQQYSPVMLAEFQAITTSGTIISYALYTVLGSPTDWLLLTIPYVLYGIFRYIYLIDQKGEGAAPDETLLRDKPILITTALFVITAIAVLLLAPRG